MPFRYPIALELAGRQCVVIGGSKVSEEKVRGLLVAGASVTVISERPTEGIESMAGVGEISLLRKGYAYGDLEDAFLAIAATEDRSVNPEIFKEAEERGVLLNAVDDVAHCHFAAPAIVRRGDFLLAISTGGNAPALARRLREQLSNAFGPEYGTLVDVLGDVRAETIEERTVDFATWAARWQAALDRDLLALIRRGRRNEAAETVRRIVADGDPVTEDVSLKERPRCGRVFIVGAGPGDPDLITVRGRKAVEAADVVVYDRLVHPSLVQDRSAIFVGKEPGNHKVSQEEINELLVCLAREGKSVVRLKGGDPFVFGRGGEEAAALAAAGIPFEVISGPTAGVAAPASAGIPVTDRRFASSVAIVTGHCTEGRAVDWRRLATAVDTIVILMGLGSLRHIVEELLAGGLDPETPAAVIENATLPDERVLVAPVSELPEAAALDGVRSPATVVIGDVVRLRHIVDQGERREERALSTAGAS